MAYGAGEIFIIGFGIVFLVLSILAVLTIIVAKIIEHFFPEKSLLENELAAAIYLTITGGRK